ncbi:MAG: type II CAAX prenyl endopeptidase Rce1 family protein [Bacteroidia bacterium]
MNLFLHFTQNCRNQPYFALAASICLLLFMLLLSNLFIMALLPIFHVSLEEIQILLSGAVTNLSIKERILILASQGFAQIFTWGFVGWVMMKCSGFSFANTQEIAPVLRILPFGVLLLWLAIPLVQVLTFTPENFHLPKIFSFLENYLKNQDDSKSELIQALLQTKSSIFFLSNLFVLALLPAICEELLFRGFLQQLFCQKMKPIWAIIWSSFIFSAIHFQFLGFLPRFLLGMMLGYLFYRSKHLITSIVAHFAFNSVTIVAMYVVATQKMQIDVEGYAPSVSVIIISILLIMMTLWRVERLKNP